MKNFQINSGEINMRIKGFEELEKKLREKIEKAQNIEVIKDDIGLITDTDIRKNFEKEESPSGKKWIEWSETTKKYRKNNEGKKKDLGEKKLRFENDLYKSLAYKKTKYGVIYGTINQPIKYARIHQYGGKAGRGRKVYIPSRPYIGISIRLKEKIKRYILDNT